MPSRTGGGPWRLRRRSTVARRGGRGRPVVGSCLGPGQDQRVIAGDGEHRVQAAALAAAAELGVVAVGFVAGDPAERQQRIVGGAFDHSPGQLRLGREHRPRGDAGVGESVGVGEPGLGQIKLSVDEDTLLVGVDVGGEHPDLTVGDLPCGAGVLALHPGRAPALLLKPGVVYDQHPLQGTEPFGHLSPQRVPQPAGVPARMVQQPLHPIRRGVPGQLGQRPAILTLQRAQQTQQIRPGPQPRLSATEQRRCHLREQFIEPLRPGSRVDLHYSGRHGHRRSFGSHTPS